MTIRAYTNLTREELTSRGFGPVSAMPTRLGIGAFGQIVTIIFDESRHRYYWEFLLGRREPLSPVDTKVLESIGPAFFTGYAQRQDLERGRYEYRTALCVRSAYTPDNFISAGSISDLLEMAELIRTGLIRPTSSYQRPQVESLPREFRQLWREFWALVRRQLAEWRFKMDRYASTPK